MLTLTLLFLLLISFFVSFFFSFFDLLQLVSTLALVVLRPGSSLECTEQDQTYIRNLVWFMSQHYAHVFKVREAVRVQHMTERENVL